jgi:hypothetical protein
MSRRKNNFTKAMSHLKSNQMDEKIKQLEEQPTNNTMGLMTVADPSQWYQPPDVEVPELDFNLGNDDDNGMDTRGIFNDQGEILTIEPDVGDTSYILGPMASMWYGWGNFSTFGYIRQEDRKMVNLGRITGRLSNWDGVSNFTSYGQLTLEQAVWFMNTPKKDNAGNEASAANYRAFYPGPPSNTPDQYGRYLCTITGTPKLFDKTPPGYVTNPTQGPEDASDQFSMLAWWNDKGKKDAIDKLRYDPNHPEGTNQPNPFEPGTPLYRNFEKQRAYDEHGLLGSYPNNDVQVASHDRPFSRYPAAGGSDRWPGLPSDKLDLLHPSKDPLLNIPITPFGIKAKNQSAGTQIAGLRPDGSQGLDSIGSYNYGHDGTLYQLQKTRDGKGWIPIKKAKNKGNTQVAHYEPQGMVLTESRKRILREIKKPYKVPKTPTKFKGIRPKVRVTGKGLMEVPEIPKQFKPEPTIWRKPNYDKNVRSSQEKKNEVLEYVGAAADHWEYLTETRRKEKNAKRDAFYATKKDRDFLYDYWYGGKKHKVIRKEDIDNDCLVYIEDEDGKKFSMLQSKLNEMIEEEKMKDMFDSYIPEEEQGEREKNFDKVTRLKSIVGKIKRGDIGPEYPNEPPPELVNGWHPKLGKKYKHDKLDPQSAEAMPDTGNPEIDANIKKATDSKSKARKLKTLLGKKIDKRLT